MIRQIIDATFSSLILGINSPNIFNSTTNLPRLAFLLTTFFARPYFFLYHRIPTSRYLSVDTFVIVLFPYLLLRTYDALHTIFSLVLYYYSFFTTVRGNGTELGRECAWIDEFGDDWRIRYKSECAGYSDGINADGNILGHVLRAVLDSISDKIFRSPTTVVGAFWFFMFVVLTSDLLILLFSYTYKRAGEGTRWFMSQVKSFWATATREKSLNRVYWPFLAMFIVWKLYEIINYWLWSIIWLLEFPFDIFIGWIFAPSLRFVVRLYYIYIHSEILNQGGIKKKGLCWFQFFPRVGSAILGILTDPFGWGASLAIVGAGWALKMSLYITDTLAHIIHVFLALIGCGFWLAGRESVRGLSFLVVLFVVVHFIQQFAFVAFSILAPHILEPYPAISPAIDNAVVSLSRPVRYGASLLGPIIKPMTFFSTVVWIFTLHILDLNLPAMLRIFIGLNFLSWWILHIFYSAYEKISGRPEEKTGGVLNGELSFTPVFETFEEAQTNEMEPNSKDAAEEEVLVMKPPATMKYITPIAWLSTFAYFGSYLFLGEHNPPTAVWYFLEFNTYIWWMMYFIHDGKERAWRWQPDEKPADGSTSPSNVEDPKIEEGEEISDPTLERLSPIESSALDESEDIETSADEQPVWWGLREIPFFNMLLADPPSESASATSPFPLFKPKDIDTSEDEEHVWWGLREIPLFDGLLAGVRLLVKWESNPVESKLTVDTNLNPSAGQIIQETRNPSAVATTTEQLPGQIVQKATTPIKVRQEATPLPTKEPRSATSSASTPKTPHQIARQVSQDPIAPITTKQEAALLPTRLPPSATSPPTTPSSGCRSAGRVARETAKSKAISQDNTMSPVKDANSPVLPPTLVHSPTVARVSQGPVTLNKGAQDTKAPVKDTMGVDQPSTPNRKPEPFGGRSAEKAINYYEYATREEAKATSTSRP